jgi:acyl-CoA synthetase (NDP forming)
MRDLTPLLAPRSVAVVGASDDVAKWGYGVARAVLRGGARRRVHLVNARATTVAGLAAVASLRDIGEPVDCAVLVVPAPLLEAVVEDGLAAGVRAFIGFATGFAEAGAAGREVEERLARRVREAGAVLLGPNCMGAWAGHVEFDAAWLDAPVGPFAFVSQSGGLGVEVGAYARELRLGLSHFVSVGNQADLTIADVIDHLVSVPEARVIGVYCEDFRDGRAFLASVDRAAAAGKPVLVISPSGPSAARAAGSHTGSLVSDGRVVEAALRDAGALLVATPEEMMEAAAALLGPSLPVGARVAVLADGGGVSVIAASLLAAEGFVMPELSTPLQEAIRRERPGAASTANPIDLTAVLADLDLYARLATHLLTSGEVDAVLLAGSLGTIEHESPERTIERDACATIAAAVAAAGRPLVAALQWTGEPAWQTLRDGGVPAYRRLSAAVRSLALAHRFATATRRVAPVVPVAGAKGGQTGYLAARALVAAAGVPLVAARAVDDAGAAAAAAAAIGYPVVVKAMHAEHKSDGGGVVLGVADDAALRGVVARLHEQLGPCTLTVERQADVSDGVEVVVGVRRDPRFGPVAMVGLGGVLVELLDDVALALAPLTDGEAATVLARLRGYPLLTGHRGRPAVDLSALCAAIAAVTRCAAANPWIAELECNPIVATPRGAVALDARVLAVARP